LLQDIIHQVREGVVASAAATGAAARGRQRRNSFSYGRRPYTPQGQHHRPHVPGAHPHDHANNEYTHILPDPPPHIPLIGTVNVDPPPHIPLIGTEDVDPPIHVNLFVDDWEDDHVDNQGPDYR